jgi:hypothetical protein
MSDEKASLSTISVLAGEFESYNDLQSYCDHQYHTINQITKENQELKSKVEHLEALVQSTTDLKVKRIEESPEQLICEIQITKLKSKSFERELTLEETKRLEILIRSLYLIKEKGEGELTAEFKSLTESISVENLAQIASRPDFNE